MTDDIHGFYNDVYTSHVYTCIIIKVLRNKDGEIINERYGDTSISLNISTIKSTRNQT